MKFVKYNCGILLMLLCCYSAAVAEETPEQGRLLFVSRCAGCHNVNKTVTGPALAGIEERRSFGWIVQFVQSPKTLINSGDKDAVSLYEKFGHIVMPDHPDLTEKQITVILEYIKTQTKEVSEKPPFSKPGRLRPAYIPIPLTNYWFYLGYVFGVLVLSGALILLVHVKAIQRAKGNR